MSDNKICKSCGVGFPVDQWDINFLDKISPVFSGKKFNLPYPTLCVDCRHTRRLIFRNERTIYKRKCDLCLRSMVAIYPEKTDFPVYCHECWYGDKWNAFDYGRDYDFTRGFFDQFQELRKLVPRIGLLNERAENSEFCNITTGNKNCYLVWGGDFNEDSFNSIFCFKSKNVSDTYWVNSCELSYECVDCEKCYNVKYSRYAYTSRDSAFLFDCHGCSNCFSCFGLRNKSYCIYNEQFSREEYEQKIKSFELDKWSSVQKLSKEFSEFCLKFPHEYVHMVNVENCTGDSISSAKNCINCFDIFGGAEDIKDAMVAGDNAKDMFSMDHGGHDAELFYECLASFGGRNYLFCMPAWRSSDCFYCDFVISSNNLFGCAQLQNAKYCVLNKEYSKNEWEILCAKIVEDMIARGEWGEFFPMEHSFFAYNETVANDFYTLEKGQVLAKGLKWMDEKVYDKKSDFVIPDSINDVSDDIIDKVLVCESTGRLYKITPAELKLYRKIGVSLPRYAPETRNVMRLKSRNPKKLWDRECMCDLDHASHKGGKCDVRFLTSYSPERKEMIFCEKCYLGVTY